MLSTMLTPNELARRRKHIGASEVSALFGLSPWKNAYDVWLEKTGKLETIDNSNEAIALGHAMEGHLLRWAAHEEGIKIVRNQFRVHAGGILSATHDALARDGQPIGFEAKTAGVLRGYADREEWGEDGTDQIPEGYLLQCMAQMAVSGLDVVIVPALLGGRGRALYRVLPNKDLIEAIVERVGTFWEKHVLTDTPPEGVPSIEIVRHVRRTPGKRIRVDSELVKAWRVADFAEKQAKEKNDEAKARLLAMMGDADEGDSDMGIVKVSKTKTSRIDVDKLRKEFPEIAAKVTKETESPRITFKKNKE